MAAGDSAADVTIVRSLCSCPTSSWEGHNDLSKFTGEATPNWPFLPIMCGANSLHAPPRYMIRDEMTCFSGPY